MTPTGTRATVLIRSGGCCERCGETATGQPKLWQNKSGRQVRKHPTACQSPTVDRSLTVTDRTCSHSDCRLKHYSLGYCLVHYQRSKRGADMDAPIVDYSAPLEACELDGCDNPARSHRTAVCEMHYYRMRRNGTYDLKPKPERKPKPDRRLPGVSKSGKVPRRWQLSIMALCRADGCQEPSKSKGYCGMHWERVRKHGDPEVVVKANWTGDDATYGAVHLRLRNTLGAASEYECICGRSARHWAYLHNDPAERTSDMGPYSLDQDCYLPMCARCHKLLDMGRL